MKQNYNVFVCFWSYQLKIGCFKYSLYKPYGNYKGKACSRHTKDMMKGSKHTVVENSQITKDKSNRGNREHRVYKTTISKRQ